MCLTQTVQTITIVGKHGQLPSSNNHTLREYSAQGAWEYLLGSSQELFSVIHLPLGTANKLLILGTSFIQGQVLAASGKGLPGKVTLEAKSHHKSIQEQPFCPCLAASHLPVTVCKSRKQRRVGSSTGAHRTQVSLRHMGVSGRWY